MRRLGAISVEDDDDGDTLNKEPRDDVSAFEKDGSGDPLGRALSTVMESECATDLTVQESDECSPAVPKCSPAVPKCSPPQPSAKKQTRAKSSQAKPATPTPKPKSALSKNTAPKQKSPQAKAKAPATVKTSPGKRQANTLHDFMRGRDHSSSVAHAFRESVDGMVAANEPERKRARRPAKRIAAKSSSDSCAPTGSSLCPSCETYQPEATMLMADKGTRVIRCAKCNALQSRMRSLISPGCTFCEDWRGMSAEEKRQFRKDNINATREALQAGLQLRVEFRKKRASRRSTQVKMASTSRFHFTNAQGVHKKNRSAPSGDMGTCERIQSWENIQMRNRDERQQERRIRHKRFDLLTARASRQTPRITCSRFWWPRALLDCKSRRGRVCCD